MAQQRVKCRRRIALALTFAAVCLPHAACTRTPEAAPSLSVSVSPEAKLAQSLAKTPGGERPQPPAFPFDEKAARRWQRAYADWLGVPVEFTNDLDMSFVLVPPGEFIMGSPESEPGRGGGERAFGVVLTRPFYLARHEVTVAQFRRFVADTGYVTDIEKSGGGHAHDGKAVWQHRPGTSWRKPGYAGPFEQRDDHPVVHVSHTDSLAFCKWLQIRSGLPADGALAYGLPGEAQWEWACRAGSGARYWWGDEEDTTGQVANVGDRALKRVHPQWPRQIMPMDDGHAFAAPVGSYRANGFGLHDMLGNVWEFCATRHGPYPPGPATNPGDLSAAASFSVRGGGWSNVPADARCAGRNSDPPHSNLGFRVAIQIGPRATGEEK